MKSETASPVTKCRLGVVLAVIGLGFWAIVPDVRADCLPIPGDITGDGDADVVDVQCGIVYVLVELSNPVADPPECVGVSPDLDDLNCDDAFDVSDIQLLILAALTIPLPPVVDSNGNNCVDACEAATTCLSTLCDDGNPCSDDSCELAGCVYTANDAACNDGDACSLSDACVDSECIGGAPQFCNDFDECTVDGCVPAIGCTYVATQEPCDDDDACTVGETCAGGTCDSGIPVPCSDGLFCNGPEFCDSSVGCLSGPPPNVNDWLDCTMDSCVEIGNQIIHEPIDALCDDNVPCTIDACNVETGCSHTAQNAICVDSNPCSTNVCDPAAGCVDWPIEGTPPCDDGNACTALDQCSATVCSGIWNDCDDQDPCTDDSCDEILGCAYSLAAGAPCDDGNACTDDDACDGLGNCVGGGSASCDDQKTCTEDSCTIEDGCTHTPLPGQACDDSNACSLQDTCNATGACISTAPLDCADTDPCTADSCIPETGCTHEPTTGPMCDDDDECTDDDTCTNGTCAGALSSWCTEVPMCIVVGLEGDTLSCFFYIAQALSNDPPPCAVQFIVTYNSEVAEIDNFYDELCIPGLPCFDLVLTGPGNQPLSTGHSATIVPDDLADWAGLACEDESVCNEGNSCVNGLCENSQGRGAIILYHPSAAAVPLTGAYLQADGTVVGDPEFLEARFTLLGDFTEVDDSWIKATKVNSFQGNTNDLDTDVINLLFVTSLP